MELQALGFLRSDFIRAADVFSVKHPSMMMFTCMTHSHDYGQYNWAGAKEDRTNKL